MIPFGDDAIRFAVPAGIADRRALLARLRGVPGVRDVVLAETVGCVVFIPGAERGLVDVALAGPLGGKDAAVAEHRVRIVYDGIDLPTVADAIGMSTAKVTALHSGAEYVVATLGFLPGFAYLRGLPEALVLPRRAPRPRVAPRSVAIGAEYTGIYPFASAGGWHLLGRALGLPRFELGDRVRFEPVEDGDSPEAPTHELTPPRGRHAVVTRVAGLALFVDGGRAGQMHVGMPPGGPLVRAAFDEANANVGNAPGTCAIEVTGQLEVEVDGVRGAIASGASRVAYLAVEGGFDAPLLEGGRGALLSAGIGRPLRRGDAVGAGGRLASASAREPDEAIVLRPGPDARDDVIAELCAAEFQISPTSDRTGTRLVGSVPAVDAGRRASTPMVEGAIELAPSGLVVLGPDHPTTGGYPVVAVVARESRDAFFARPLGARVRFRL